MLSPLTNPLATYIPRPKGPGLTPGTVNFVIFECLHDVLLFGIVVLVFVLYNGNQAYPVSKGGGIKMRLKFRSVVALAFWGASQNLFADISISGEQDFDHLKS